MMVTYDLMFALGTFLVSLIVVIYLEDHIEKNFLIANIVSTKVMSIYMIFCILIALSIGYVLFEMTHQMIMAAITLLLLIGVYWFLFLPKYHRWKELLADWIGSSPKNEINSLKEKISHLTKRINIDKEKRDTLSSIALRVDAIYCRQRLESLERSRSAAKSMKIFVVACPAISLMLEIWIWLRW